MWDTLCWGGETQALIYNPKTRKVIGINALGVAPTGATAEFYKSKGMTYPPEYGPLAAVTPGTPGGIMVMLAEYGKLCSRTCSSPPSRLADGFPIEAQLANAIEREKARLKQWPLLARGDAAAPRRAARVAAARRNLQAARPRRDAAQAGRGRAAARSPRGKNRKEAIYAAYDRFYRGDIARR